MKIFIKKPAVITSQQVLYGMINLVIINLLKAWLSPQDLLLYNQIFE